MDWPEIIVEGFPGPRDGEPPHLRRDIADELNDHLACAMQRELRRTDDPAAAENAVLHRFGNPKRIARQLWWDAMKEQVMKDRLMIGMMVLIAIVCIAVGYFAWQMMQQGQQINQAVLARLESLGHPTTQPSVAPDWGKITFRCYEGEGQGRPAAGVHILLNGNAFNDTKEDQIQQTTDASGLTTFGPIRPGRYRYKVSPQGFVTNERVLSLYPGHTDKLVFNVPAPETSGEISLQVNWPSELKNKGYLLDCSFDAEPLEVGGARWAPNGWGIVVKSNGELSSGYAEKVVAWPVELQADWSGGIAPFSRVAGSDSRLTLCSENNKSVTWQPQMRRPATRYRLDSITIMAPFTDSGSSTTRWIECARFDYREEQGPRFETRSGQPNIWTIDVPTSVVADIDESFARSAPRDTLTDIKLQIEWPADLVDKGLPVLCKFEPDSTDPRTGANQWWRINDWEEVLLADASVLRGYTVRRESPSPPRPPGPMFPHQPTMTIDARAQDLTHETTVRRPSTTYRLISLSVLAPLHKPNDQQLKW